MSWQLRNQLDKVQNRISFAATACKEELDLADTDDDPEPSLKQAAMWAHSLEDACADAIRIAQQIQGYGR